MSCWSFLLKMRYRSANPKKRKRASDVLSCLPNCDPSATSTMGFFLPAGSVRAVVLFQLLVSFSGADHRSFLDFRQLPRTAARERIFSNFVSFDVDRSSGNAVLVAARLSAGVLPLVLRQQEKRSVLPACDHPVVGELSGARLCMENDPGQRRCSQYIVAVRSSHPASLRFSAVQPICCGVDAHSHLHSVCFFADLRIARAHTASSGRSIAGPGCIAISDFLEGDFSSLDP